ncbi:hypothetical protein PMZ80_006874 [Knufia obscura]|uniref:DUF3669 domain-containing protein n=1 Tax=Knufia obscura TaxID=1635080 RepID=A0ABR0RJQ9_9EURO|nr:hypothetical protein PMZ80_006874 [Knufia obscura]
MCHTLLERAKNNERQTSQRVPAERTGVHPKSTKAHAIATAHSYLSLTTHTAPSIGLWCPPDPTVSTTPPTPNRPHLWSPPPSPPLHRIGVGTCGTIHALPQPGTCIKREKNHHYTSRGLLNDWDMHQRVYSTFTSFSLGASSPVRRSSVSDPSFFVGSSGLADVHVHVPRPIKFYAKADISLKCPSWRTLHDMLPGSDRDGMARSILHMERIPALPYPLRSALIQLFCPVHIQTAAYEAPGNADCLIRPYLGRLGRGSERDSKGVAPKRSFSLRNFGLDLDKMEVLGLLTDGGGDGDGTATATAMCWAGCMGRTLAVLHWECGVDARDVEFVLGGRPASEPSRESGSASFQSEAAVDAGAESEAKDVYNLPHRSVHLWLLDFNQVGSITFDQKGVDACVEAAFRDNDPYFPRPGRGPEGLWGAFVEGYLGVSERAMRDRKQKQKKRVERAAEGEEEDVIEVEELPRRFIDGVVQMQRKLDEESRRAGERSEGAFVEGVSREQ